MHQGADVIYQATLFDGTWRGYADFLLRTDGASDLGAHHYEVADTKLARRVKGGALLQMCVYSDLVAAIQGVMPAEMHVVLGGSGYQEDSHRLDDYLAYYRSVKGRFLEAIASGDPVFPLPQAPEPVRHCKVCRWQPTCDGWRTAADHLSLVASLRTDQARRLRGGGIGTMTALATLEQPLPEVTDVADATLAGLHQQARLQYVSRDRPVPAFEFLPVEPNRGLCALPEPNPGDLFFDIEGDPFAEQDGLEYLFGVWDPSNAAEPFRAFWGHDRAAEKLAFEAFIDFVMARWQALPGHARVPLRRLRARQDGDALHPPRHARGGGRQDAHGRAVRGPLQGGAPVDAHRARQLLHQAPGAAVRARPGGAAEGCRLIDRGLRALHPLGERRRAG